MWGSISADLNRKNPPNLGVKHHIQWKLNCLDISKSSSQLLLSKSFSLSQGRWAGSDRNWLSFSFTGFMNPQSFLNMCGGEKAVISNRGRGGCVHTFNWEITNWTGDETIIGVKAERKDGWETQEGGNQWTSLCLCVSPLWFPGRYSKQEIVHSSTALATTQWAPANTHRRAWLSFRDTNS